MIIEQHEKVHVVYRALYESSTRRHLVGEVVAVAGPVCRIHGYVFIYDSKTTDFIRKQKKRTTIIDVGDCGYIVNVINNDVDLDAITYRYLPESGSVVTDGKNFELNINEFTPRT